MKNKINNQFVLITGASEGFGKALALECARRNRNLVMVALPGVELHHLADFIEKNFCVQVVCIEADLSKMEDCIKVYETVTSQQLQINILINNAGIGGTHLFEDRNVIDYHRQIQLNVTAPTVLTRLFLDNLKANGPSHVLNVSSLASFFCLPKKQVYAATKSYLLAFSRSLRRELRKSNVRVSVLCPGGMNTTPALTLSNRTGTWLSQWSIMDPEQVALLAIDEMINNKGVIIPGKWNRLFLAIDRMLPKMIKEKLIDLQMSSYAPKPAFQFISSSNFFNSK
jgi:short-subunit dehydrogenase